MGRLTGRHSLHQALALVDAAAAGEHSLCYLLQPPLSLFSLSLFSPSFLLLVVVVVGLDRRWRLGTDQRTALYTLYTTPSHSKRFSHTLVFFLLLEAGHAAAEEEEEEQSSLGLGCPMKKTRGRRES